MKLAIISPFAPYRGGIAKETEVIYKYLKKNNEAKIINFSRQYPSLLFPGSNQYIGNEVNEYKNDVIRLIDTINPFSWKKTANYLLKNKYKNIIFRYWHPFFIPAYNSIAKYLLKNNNNIKLYCICDNIYPHERFILDEALINLFFKKIHYFYVMSNKTYNELNKFINKSRIKKIYLPINTKLGPLIDKDIAREKLQYKSDFSLLFFGLIRKYKGLDILLKSLPIVKKEINNIKLFIVGECYDNVNKYKDIINKYNLEKNIVWINKYIPENDINLYFSSSDLVVLPYKNTSQSGIIPISYKYNKLVLGSNIEGINDFIVEGKTGYTFKVNSYISLSEKIIDIYKNHDFSLSANYIDTFKKNFSSEKLVNDILSFMK